MIEAMEKLQPYTVECDNPEANVLLSGDGLSIERMIHALRGRNNGETNNHRLSRMWPSPQEFHKEVILLQV